MRWYTDGQQQIKWASLWLLIYRQQTGAPDDWSLPRSISGLYQNYLKNCRLYHGREAAPAVYSPTEHLVTVAAGRERWYSSMSRSKWKFCVGRRRLFIKRFCVRVVKLLQGNNTLTLHCACVLRWISQHDFSYFVTLKMCSFFLLCF